LAKKQEEGKIKTSCRVVALAAGLLFWNIEGKSLNGVPDTLCSRVAGGIMLIEFKVPGKEPTEQQYLRIWELRNQGIMAWWTDSVEGWERLVGLRPGGYAVEYPQVVMDTIDVMYGEQPWL
jgi:hypothetical protein